VLLSIVTIGSDMSIRDKEIERLIHYAKGMGVKVILYHKDDKDAVGEWTTDGSEIRIFMGKRANKTKVILTLIHELGHHVWFVHEKDRQPDLKFDDALTKAEGNGNPIPKYLRKRIYNEELAGTAWWDAIYKETDIKVPLWKMKAEMEFDMWMYETYYETGFFPRGKARDDKHKEICNKHRERGE
jgi:hypothetical protein